MANDATLKQLARGSGILFLSTFTLYFTRFFYRLLTSRYLGPENYGLLSLGIMVLNVAALLSILGMHDGIVKYISHYLGKNDKSRVKGTILSSIKISVILSLLFSLVIILFSEQIAVGLFHNSSFKPVLVIFALIIPFYSLHKILLKVFIAFKKPEYNLISSAISRELLLLILTGSVIILGGHLLHVSLVVLVSTLVAAVFAIFLMEKYVFSVIKRSIKPVYEYRKLLSFSIPLFFSVIFIEIMGWADTFFLGVLRTGFEVGIYNAALPLAVSLGVFRVAFSNMFFPIISELRAKKQINEIKTTYSVAAKWIFLLSLPLALLFIFFSKLIMSSLFGVSYIQGSTALVIIALGYFISITIGPAEAVLKTFNKVKFILHINSIVAILNIILNITLIPKYGIAGAAFSTAISIIIRDFLFLLRAKKCVNFKYKLKYYTKYILSSLIALLAVYVITTYIRISSISSLVILIMFYGFLYLVLLLLLKAIGKEDIMIISAIEKKIGINIKPIKKIIRRFI